MGVETKMLTCSASQFGVPKIVRNDCDGTGGVDMVW
jgi:hypothetical protein